MKNRFIALAGALALIGVMTACGSTYDGTAKNVVPVNPDGEIVNEPITGYNAQTAARNSDYALNHNGRYVAYPDGAIPRNRNNIVSDAKNATARAKNGVENAVKDVTHGTGNVLERAGARMENAADRI